ncbi:hypothetical protein S7335_1246 [Synechococcus sp. PCC 7335]|uniref:hypothetical protein n=1 Tax=Synechococcus sp. (strain ATCC 29403 / PCC 7335) TaxID=91464 RepID=UPI00017EB91B|nr:hypothetical protein [Synechococcus sp. PCC 7335]EDX82542.1 hypothetical protein S7335_1246 [Synechococcus sp. PCC 7335]
MSLLTGTIYIKHERVYLDKYHGEISLSLKEYRVARRFPFSPWVALDEFGLIGEPGDIYDLFPVALGMREYKGGPNLNRITGRRVRTARVVHNHKVNHKKIVSLVLMMLIGSVILTESLLLLNSLFFAVSGFNNQTSVLTLERLPSVLPSISGSIIKLGLIATALFVVILMTSVDSNPEDNSRLVNASELNVVKDADVHVCNKPSLFVEGSTFTEAWLGFMHYPQVAVSPIDYVPPQVACNVLYSVATDRTVKVKVKVGIFKKEYEHPKRWFAMVTAAPVHETITLRDHTSDQLGLTLYEEPSYNLIEKNAILQKNPSFVEGVAVGPFASREAVKAWAGII